MDSERRDFVNRALAAGLLFKAATASAQEPLRNNAQEASNVFIERDQSGQPHAGKVLAAIQPHCDDVPLYASGTVCKLIREGYTGILIRTSADDMAGVGATKGEVVVNNERVNQEVARRMGIKKIFDLNYRNHLMDEASRVEMRARLIFIFRLMKVDTIICYDPTAHYDANPDHVMTAQVVMGACWMAGGARDYPEHFEAGIHSHGVREKYYFTRGPQLVNRIVDISSVIDEKVHVNRANTSQGPAGEHGAALRAQLTAQKLKLPLLGNDDETANREYVKQVVLYQDRELGKKYGLEYAEPFHYIGPDESVGGGPDGINLQDFIKRNSVPL
ncbi:MAG TPA: PIG-L family deacetylase [Bryobacteraceae bacterium]|nr:PIG-L family deacetylase [Bryobacteraceae bacterium]